MRTRYAEKLDLSINKDASALFLLTDKRRIVWLEIRGDKDFRDTIVRL
jgi:hypothetical protein